MVGDHLLPLATDISAPMEGASRCPAASAGRGYQRGVGAAAGGCDYQGWTRRWITTCAACGRCLRRRRLTEWLARPYELLSVLL
ncbi:hypothetical protein CHLRE_02g141686v5 [Chlamydomonas reinhardtii]|uniref:Uncharacterized protein n=1 Tax=Chlamydomonas reinhardtii TaxID=3055 RepID=A0A2K3E493_CHLRE|nr:uncharacterized protein CHLRE_02g141686v5 [Chlamydomonas reinhardtii]PNW87615.1 hypothetical protein CHLRE_02g141686v5 [Chlamydomonas reinhardtii]